MFGVGSLACYDSLQQIGEGTYGYVYKAKDRRSGEAVALKRLIFSRESSGFPQCAVREIKFLKSLKHQNIVKLKDVVTSKGCEHLEVAVQSNRSNADAKQEAENTIVEDDGQNIFKLCGNLYFVFEYMDHDLGGLIDMKYRFTEVEVKCIMKQIFEGLDYLHERNVIHRDIKTSNILISNRHQVKLADFGLARSTQGFDGRELKVDMSNNVITLWYRPPELLLGAVRYNATIDIWSAGCVLAELQLGRPLWPGKSEADQLDLIFKLIGTPTTETWPTASTLPLYETMLGTAIPYPNTIRSTYTPRITEHAMSLLERVFVCDPSRRITAKVALTNKFFNVAPVPPMDPTDMEPLKIEAGASYHEFETKRIKKLEESKQVEIATNPADGMTKSTSSTNIGNNTNGNNRKAWEYSSGKNYHENSTTSSSYSSNSNQPGMDLSFPSDNRNWQDNSNNRYQSWNTNKPNYPNSSMNYPMSGNSGSAPLPSSGYNYQSKAVDGKPWYGNEDPKRRKYGH